MPDMLMLQMMDHHVDEQSPRQQKKGKGDDSSQKFGDGRGVHYFGASAVSIEDLLKMVEYEQKVSNMETEINGQVVQARAKTIAAMGEEEKSMCDDDAQVTRWQIGEVAGQIGGSLAQVGGGVVASRQINPASEHHESMTNLNTELNRLPPSESHDLIGDAEPTAEQQQRTQDLERLRQQMKTKTFDFRQIEKGQGTKSRLSLEDRDGGGAISKRDTGLTLEDVLSSATSPEERQELVGKVGKAVDLAKKGLISAQNSAQVTSQIVGSTGQALGGGSGAFSKTMEANALSKKGEDSKERQAAQGSTQLLQEANQNVLEQKQKSGQTADEMLRKISEVVQVDMRG